MLASQSIPSAPKTLSLKNSSLISAALGLFYLALTLPLPILAAKTQAPIPAWLLSVGIIMGAMSLWATLSYRVELDALGLRIHYPAWVPGLLRREWAVAWAEITKLQPRGTSQGGLVYYLVTTSGTAYLLPMRVAGFSQMMRFIHLHTGLDTELIRPLAQAWMYGTLGIFGLFLLLIDLWIVVGLPTAV